MLSSISKYFCLFYDLFFFVVNSHVSYKKLRKGTMMTKCVKNTASNSKKIMSPMIFGCNIKKIENYQTVNSEATNPKFSDCSKKDTSILMES